MLHINLYLIYQMDYFKNNLSNPFKNIIVYFFKANYSLYLYILFSNILNGIANNPLYFISIVYSFIFFS